MVGREEEGEVSSREQEGKSLPARVFPAAASLPSDVLYQLSARPDSYLSLFILSYKDT